MARLGFIGIGLMGAPMTLRLLERGHEVTVWNRDPARLGAVTEAGARPAASPRDVAQASDVVGTGQIAKLVNQAIVGAGFVLMAEVLRLAEAAGIDAVSVPECLAGSLADSALLRRIFPQMQRRAFDPPLSVARQLLKDMNAVTGFAQELGLDLAMVETARAQYDAHVAAGHGMEDSAAIVRLYERPR